MGARAIFPFERGGRLQVRARSLINGGSLALRLLSPTAYHVMQ